MIWILAIVVWISLIPTFAIRAYRIHRFEVALGETTKSFLRNGAVWFGIFWPILLLSDAMHYLFNCFARWIERVAGAPIEPEPPTPLKDLRSGKKTARRSAKLGTKI
jgi:hypothetical protein